MEARLKHIYDGEIRDLRHPVVASRFSAIPDQIFEGKTEQE